MSETFGLTGVDVDPQAKPKPLEQQQQLGQGGIKKMVVSSGPKKEDPQKSSTRLPPIEQKKPNAQPNQGQGAGGQNQLGNIGGTSSNQQGNSGQQQTQQILSKVMRAKSSKSMVNVRRIDNLKKFLDSERQNKEEKGRGKKTDPINVAQYGRKMELEKQEREKKEKKTAFLDGYRKRIEDDYDQLYRQDDYGNVITQLKQLENKVKLQGEIKRNEEMLNKDQKEFNQLRYQIESKQKQMLAIQNQLSSLQYVFSTEEEKTKLAEEEAIHQDYEQKLEDETVVQMGLRNMMETRKNLLLFEKKKSEQMYKEYVYLQGETFSFEENQIKNQQKHKDIEKQLSQFQSKNGLGLHPKFQEMLEDELSEYEDKNALHEIFKHEQSRKDDQIKKEHEAKKLELEQMNFERQKQQDKVKYEQRQVEQILNQKRKNMEELLKVSCVSDISELEDRKIFLERSNQKLKRFEEEYQNSINEQKKVIVELKAQLNQLKYIQKDKPNQDAQQPSSLNSDQQLQVTQQSEIKLQVIDEVNMTANVNIDKFEQMLIEETDRLQDKENSVKRLERVVDEICLVFSRILYQLQPPNLKTKNIEVKREELRNQITICGLKLEKIISFLAKKKDSLRVESINTDAENFYPPEYVGINPRSYLRQRDLDEQRDYEQNTDAVFDYKEDDPDEFEADKYLLSLRSRIHNGGAQFEESEGQDGLNHF